VSALNTATVRAVEQAIPPTTRAPAPTFHDSESREWLESLRAEGATRDDATARLHALLLRAARFEVARRRPALPHLRGLALDDWWKER
jgi:hypothetical protein